MSAEDDLRLLGVLYCLNGIDLEEDAEPPGSGRRGAWIVNRAANVWHPVSASVAAAYWSIGDRLQALSETERILRPRQPPDL